MPAAKSSTLDSTNNPFVKQLASSNYSIRDRALSSLRTYLHRSTPFTPLDCLKLWKGLFFCMWMSDKPRSQQRLARDLADLTDVLDRVNITAWLDAFWITMSREWAGIDALRVDKYLFLIRCYVNKGFEILQKRKWQDEELTNEYLGVLSKTPLNARDPKVLNGIRYHMIDIYVDELDKVDADRTARLDTLLAPLRNLGTDSITKSVKERVQEALRDERLQDWRVENNVVQQDGDDDGQEDNEGEDDEEDFAGFGD